MDVNGTRSHLLLGDADWRACRVDVEGATAGSESLLGPGAIGFAWRKESLDLTLRPEARRFTGTGVALEIASRRASAIDSCGRLYRIADDGRSVTMQLGSKAPAETIWPPAATAPASPLRTLQGLALVETRRLVVGTSDADGLLVFDRVTCDPPATIAFPPEISFKPFDLAAFEGGGLAVLDQANRRVWRLDPARSVAAGSAVAWRDDALRAGRSVPVHCGAGCGRSRSRAAHASRSRARRPARAPGRRARPRAARTASGRG